MRKLLLFPLLLLAACDVFSGPETTDPLDREAMLEHLNYLAGDSLYGRGSGSEYELEAAEYVRDEFDEYGLEPGVSGWLQHFTFTTGAALGPDGGLVGDDAGGAAGAGWDGMTRGNRTFASVSVQERYSSQNVLGVLPGDGDLADQWVVIGAHYDHVGFTQVSQDSVLVYNGADDNASGTALLLEVARYLGHHFTRGVARSLSRRSLMFQAYGAEERGLHGSRFFVNNPTVPLDSITAMINLDMIGRLRNNELYVFGSTTSPLWSPLLFESNEHGIDLLLAGSTGRSDHQNFYDQQIPVVFFWTGFHDQYHEPEDDVWLLDLDGMEMIGDLTIAILLDLLVRPEPPTFLF